MEFLNESSSNLVFIDPNVLNYDELATSVGSEFETILLNPNQDGINQITEVITQKSNVESVHIISHGSLGSLQLGDSTLNSDNLDEYIDPLTSWSDYLSEDADIVLYGCDIGKDGNFVEQLANLTGADIAASDDLTGNSALGGDWDLEVQTGDIEADLALSDEAIANFDGILNDFVVDNDPNFQNELLLNNLDFPIAMDWLPDGRALLLTKDGDIDILDFQSSVPSVSDYMNISDIITINETGLMDIAIDPDFETNNYFYLYYTDGSDRQFQISRFEHQGDTGDLASEEVIWKDPTSVSSPEHFGGGLSFGPDGKLYLSMGDKGFAAPEKAQDLSVYEGKIIRINKEDGSAPADNPFVNDPNALPEIWAYGVRNPFRSDWDIEGENYYFGDVGQDTWEEVNRLGINEGGANFGWNIYEGSSGGEPGFTDPLYQYNHNGGGGAVIAGSVYRGTTFPSEFQGSYFFGERVRGQIRYLQFDGNGDVIDADPTTPEPEAFKFEDRSEARNLVWLDDGPDGALYYLRAGGSLGGQLHRISYNDPSGNNSPVIDEQATTAAITNGLTVDFTGVATDADGDSLTYIWDFGDGNQATGANVSHTYASNGEYSPRLIVSDSQAEDSLILSPIVLGAPPTASVTIKKQDGTPWGVNDLFRAGDTILFEATATDPDGVLTESSYNWDIEFIHDEHTHPEANDLPGSSGSFQVTTTEHGFSSEIQIGFEFILTVTDSDGLTATDSFSIFPEKVDIGFNDNLPGDFDFTLDGFSRTSSDSTPYTVDTAVNFQHEAIAPSTVEVDGIPYLFAGWSDGTEMIETAPTLNFPAPDTDFTYIANYTVDDPNPDPEPPVANNDSLSIVTNSQNNALDVLSNDTDPDPGDTFTITEVSATSNGGTVSINASNDGLIYTPVNNFNGLETFTYTITDSTGLTSTAQVSVDVAELSSVPVTDGLVLQLDANSGVTTDSSGIVTAWNDQSAASNDLTSVTGDPTVITNALNGNNVVRLDGDGDKLERLGGVNLPGDNTDRSIFMVAQYNSSGSGGFSYGRARTNRTFGLMVGGDGDLVVKARGNANDADSNIDGTGAGWLTQSAVLANGTMNHYKDGALIDSQTRTYDTDLDKILLGADIDSSPFVDMEVAEILVFDRALSETERQQVESYLQQKYFSSSPGGGNSGGGNTAPVAVDDSATTSQGTGVSINVLSNDSDGDGDPLELSIFNNPSLGIAVVDDGGTPNDLTDDLILYTPNASSTGDDSFTYQVSDGNGGTDTATVSVNITSIAGFTNTPPTASVDNFSVDEDSSNTVLNVLANDTDPDIESGSGSVDFSGYTIETANDKVLKVFDTVSSGGLENATLVFDATNTGGTAPHFMNPPSSAPEFLTMHNVGGNGPQINFTMTRQDGLPFGFKSFKYTSDAFFQAGGNDLNAGFTVIGTTTNGEEVTQAFGPANTTQVFQTATLTGEQWNNLLSVEFVGDRIAEGTELTQSLNIDDIEVTAPALTIDSVTSGDQGGTLTVNSSSDGLLYTPEADFTGTETFQYTVNDGNGGTDTATVTVNVNNINDAPTAGDDSYNISLDSSDNLLSVLDNDTDIDPGDSLSLLSVGTPSNGTVAINNSGDGLLYTSSPGYTGTDSFSYTIQDLSGATSTATVNLNISQTSSVPVTNGLVLQLDANSGVTTDSSGIVTAWSDQSAVGNDLTSVTGDPTLITNALNGNNVVRLDGDGDKLERLGGVNLPGDNTDRSIFMVAQYNSSGSGGFSYGRARTNRTFGLMVGGDGDLVVKARGNANDADSNIDGTGAGWLTQSAVLANGTMNHYKDGALIDSQTRTYDTDLDKILLGADIDSSPFVDMEVAEILIYDGALSEAERQQVETYLQQKYFAV